MTTTEQQTEPTTNGTAAPMPTNVVAALARVAAELPGIGRNQDSQQGYKYRGIEAITAEAQHLLGRYGVVFVPRVLRREVKDFTINSKPWTEDQAWITYTVYGPGGAEDCIEVGPLVALGRDNSDKGMNKCMTQAFKYALLQTLCIGDAKDDADRDEARQGDAKGDWWTETWGENGEARHNAEREQLVAYLRQLPSEAQTEFKQWRTEKGEGYVLHGAASTPDEVQDMAVKVAALAADYGVALVAPETPPSPSETPAAGAPRPGPSQTPAERPGASQPPPGAKVDAPQPEEVPLDALGSIEGATDEDAQWATDVVKAMTQVREVDKELTSRRLNIEGTADERRARLAAALVRELVAERAEQGRLDVE